MKTVIRFMQMEATAWSLSFSIFLIVAVGITSWGVENGTIPIISISMWEGFLYHFPNRLFLGMHAVFPKRSNIQLEYDSLPISTSSWHSYLRTTACLHIMRLQAYRQSEASENDESKWCKWSQRFPFHMKPVFQNLLLLFEKYPYFNQIDTQKKSV